MYVLPADERQDASGYGQFVIAILGAVVTVLGWWWKRGSAGATTSALAQVDAAVERLAQNMYITWSDQLIQRRIETPVPARVRWAWVGEAVGLGRRELNASPSLATDPVPLPGLERGPSEEVLGSGTVIRLHDEVYARLRHGRLVLVGGAGAGKTGAMILLLLQALRHRRTLHGPARAEVPVPVWLPLGSWDPKLQNLREWVAATLSRDHPYLLAADFGQDAIAQMVDARRLALFLDGLDEMPDALRVEAIRRLRSESSGLRLVMSSRSDEYRLTVDMAQLPFTAVIEICPLRPRLVAEYLLAGCSDEARPQWQQLVDHLLACPESVVARTLRTPLALNLARSAYQDADPTRLLSPELDSDQALRAHLLDHVLVAAYREPEDRSHARYWLGWLAHNMGTGRELPWWRIPAWLPRLHLCVAVGLVFGIMIAAMVGMVFGFVVGPLAGLGLAFMGESRPQVLVPRWPTRPRRFPDLR